MLSFFILVSGCSNVSSKSISDPNSELILTVNGGRITSKDVKEELALRAKQDPSFKLTPAIRTQQIEIIVNRRILIQEAMRRKLAGEENFVKTIRNFWEQTLIRNLLNQLSGELEKSVTVSAAEVDEYYSKMSYKITFQVARNSQKKAVEELEQKLKQGQDILWDEKIGPVEYEAVASPILANAFSLSTGEHKVYSEGNVTYLVRILTKEPIVPPALDSVRTKIELQIKQHKQQAAFEDWLREKRSQAKIIFS